MSERRNESVGTSATAATATDSDAALLPTNVSVPAISLDRVGSTRTTPSIASPGASSNADGENESSGREASTASIRSGAVPRLRTTNGRSAMPSIRPKSTALASGAAKARSSTSIADSIRTTPPSVT